jgi:hypothetical protein
MGIRKILPQTTKLTKYTNHNHLLQLNALKDFTEKILRGQFKIKRAPKTRPAVYSPGRRNFRCQLLNQVIKKNEVLFFDIRQITRRPDVCRQSANKVFAGQVLV